MASLGPGGVARDPLVGVVESQTVPYQDAPSLNPMACSGLRPAGVVEHRLVEQPDDALEYVPFAHRPVSS